jgi:hypothetical protein
LRRTEEKPELRKVSVETLTREWLPIRFEMKRGTLLDQIGAPR